MYSLHSWIVGPPPPPYHFIKGEGVEFSKFSKKEGVGKIEGIVL